MPAWHLTFDGGGAVMTELESLDEMEQNVLQRHFGIGTTVQSDVEIAERYGVTKTRINQIKNKGLDKLRRLSCSQRLSPYVLPVDQTYPAWLASLRRIREAAKEGSERLQMPIRTPDEPLPKEVITLFLQSVDILPLSVRASNALSDVGVDLIGELVQLTPEKLKEIRNFGKKSLDDLQTALEKLGLILATILTDMQMRQFDEAKAEFRSKSKTP
jgi:hypothetical protein